MGFNQGVLVELTNVKGVGESAAAKLRSADIENVEELSDLDLRSREIEGLSSENLATLRENARRLLEARESGNLELVEGLGPSAREKLQAAGVETIRELAELDLRGTDVQGLSTEHVQKLKRNAGYLLP